VGPQLGQMLGDGGFVKRHALGKRADRHLALDQVFEDSQARAMGQCREHLGGLVRVSSQFARHDPTFFAMNQNLSSTILDSGATDQPGLHRLLEVPRCVVD
jgi:hypothetical protein